MDTWTVLVVNESSKEARMFSIKAWNIVEAGTAAEAIVRDHFAIVQITRE